MKKILYLAAEALPFASSGGLGDVMGALPTAIKRERPDSDVRVIMPLYSAIADVYREKMTLEKQFTVDLSWRKQYCAVFSYLRDGVTYYFIDNEYYFKRPALYGQFDDAERFSYFCHAALRAMRELDFFPDVLHCNDWQTAPAVIFLKTLYAHDADYSSIKTVFSIHNIMYQGIYDFSILGDIFGLPENTSGIVEYAGRINLMKGAIVCSDLVGTVSETYAKEIRSPEYSHGLDPMIRMYEGKVFGILNGIDLEYYDPQRDEELFKNYTYRSTGRKAENKRGLCKMLGLDESTERPLISVISRLTDQKGLDLIMAVADRMLERDVSFVVLGCGDPLYEAYFASLQDRYPDKVRTLLTYNKALSKKIYAASDLFLMPSKTEPCGLSQMIASRYGAVPIVRETGGLYDSIKPYFAFPDGSFEGNGFTFASYNADDMLYVINQALDLYDDKDAMKALCVKAMRTDFSWNASAAKYAEIYDKLT